MCLFLLAWLLFVFVCHFFVPFIVCDNPNRIIFSVIQMHQYSFNYVKVAFTIMIRSINAYVICAQMVSLVLLVNSNNIPCGKLLFLCMFNIFSHLVFIKAGSFTHLIIIRTQIYKSRFRY